MMMRNSKFVKAITLSLFIFLITGFVAYRSGTFENKGADRSSGRSGTLPVDSPPVKPTVMHSTKSAPVVHPAQTNQSKSSSNNANQNTNQQVKKDTSRKKVIMSSSKSGLIFKENTEPPMIMGSSKSGPVFTPKKDTTQKKN